MWGLNTFSVEELDREDLEEAIKKLIDYFGEIEIFFEKFITVEQLLEFINFYQNEFIETSKRSIKNEEDLDLLLEKLWVDLVEIYDIEKSIIFEKVIKFCAKINNSPEQIIGGQELSRQMAMDASSILM